MSTGPDTAAQQESAQTPPYRYTSLQPGDIRILTLDAGSGDDELSGTFETAKLSDSPRYSAISYAWGEPVFSGQLHLPEGTIGITESLNGALRTFRQSESPVRLWADAVCINQHDIEEKNDQVREIASVYQQAERVLIWLGPEEPYDIQNLWVLTRLHELLLEFRTCTRFRYCPYPTPQLAWETVISQPHPKKSSKQASCPCCGLGLTVQGTSWSAIISCAVEFFHKKWFSRLWVLQESLLANDAHFFCGKHHLPREVVCNAIRYLHLYFREPGTSQEKYDEMAALLVFTGLYPRNEDTSLINAASQVLNVLVESRSTLCNSGSMP